MQNHGIFKRKHQGTIGKRVCTCQFTVPEVKFVFVICYWLVHSIVIVTASSIRDGRLDIFYYHLRNYADCMAGGNRKDHDCHRLRQDLEAETSPLMEPIIFISIALLNYATLSFVIQFQTVKNSIARRFSRTSSIYTK